MAVMSSAQIIAAVRMNRREVSADQCSTVCATYAPNSWCVRKSHFRPGDKYMGFVVSEMLICLDNEGADAQVLYNIAHALGYV